ncbi:hypothetical protein MBLNU457_g2885t1 [Dothideomycetes sp. NU457]
MATPCPQRRSVDFRQRPLQNDSTIQRLLSDQGDDDTIAVVSRALRNTTTSARTGSTIGHSLARKPRRNVAITISEDETAQGYSREQDERVHHKGHTMFAKPPKKVPSSTPKQDEVQNGVPWNDQENTERDHEPATQRSAIVNGSVLGNHGEARDSRRRTIWMPPDDTTVMTIHPGAHTHTVTDDTMQLANALRSVTIASQQTMSSRESHTSLSTAPKRVPLSRLKTSEPNTVHGDIEGAPGGKENIPPGTSSSAKQDPVMMPKRSSLDRHGPTYVRSQPVQDSRVCKSTTSSQTQEFCSKRSQPHGCLLKPQTRPLEASVRGNIPGRDSKSVSRTSRTVHRQQAVDRSISHRSSQNASRDFRKSLQIAPPRAPASLSTYPILAEDLQHPELIEDNWLEYQETSLTQLINGLFEQAHRTKDAETDRGSIRRRLLHIYQQDQTVELYKRLTASLECGALALPKNAEPGNIQSDVGLRRQFLDLWLTTYQHDVLRAGAEVIVGRQSQQLSTQDHGASGADTGKISTSVKSLESFLTAFFIRHDDTSNSALASGKTSKFFVWQKMVLRSLMLIQLLDTAADQGILHGCLFRLDSSHKSSMDVLKACAKLICPSIGDITRPLGYMAYKVSHLQHPIRERKYHIDNLAVDLCDGVLLTHLVELLLYPPTALTTFPDQTVTINLPSGDLLASGNDPTNAQTVWPLSQHLKFPCQSRTQRLANVSIALAALSGTAGSVGTAISNIKAEDIVDGHREKTLSLLWTLISRWGLHYILDKADLLGEIRRIADDESLQDLEECEDESEAREMANLLRLWARSLCAPQGIPIDNLTTSFADGRALGAIVDAYARYMPTTSLSRLPISNQINLGSKLEALNCSQAFIALILATTSHVPSRTTTISTLAFLASRLIPLSKSHRAVSKIQRAWRLCLARRTMKRRIVLAKLAANCAVVVATKEKIVRSAVVLQRAWRQVLDTRIRTLVQDVTAFQTVTRAWAVRRALKGSLSGVRGGQRRVLGGW